MCVEPDAAGLDSEAVMEARCGPDAAGAAWHSGKKRDRVGAQPRHLIRSAKRGLTMEHTPVPVEANDGSILLGWLALLGWQIAIERDGGLFVGHGVQIEQDTVLRIGGCARSRAELAWQLFEAGCATVSRQRRAVERSPVAA